MVREARCAEGVAFRALSISLVPRSLGKLTPTRGGVGRNRPRRNTSIVRAPLEDNLLLDLLAKLPSGTEERQFPYMKNTRSSQRILTQVLNEPQKQSPLAFP